MRFLRISRQGFGPGSNQRVQVACALTEDVHGVSVALCLVLNAAQCVDDFIEHGFGVTKFSVAVYDFDAKRFEGGRRVAGALRCRVHVLDQFSQASGNGLDVRVDKVGHILEFLQPRGAQPSLRAQFVQAVCPFKRFRDGADDAGGHVLDCFGKRLHAGDDSLRSQVRLQDVAEGQALLASVLQVVAHFFRGLGFFLRGVLRVFQFPTHFIQLGLRVVQFGLRLAGLAGEFVVFLRGLLGFLGIRAVLCRRLLHLSLQPFQFLLFVRVLPAEYVDLLFLIRNLLRQDIGLRGRLFFC